MESKSNLSSNSAPVSTIRRVLSFVLVFLIVMVLFMMFDGVMMGKAKHDMAEMNAMSETQAKADEARQQRQYERAMQLVKAVDNVGR